MTMIVAMVMIVIVAPGVSMRFGNVRHRRAAPVAPELQKLRRQQIEADYSDHRIAHAFELVRPGIDLKSRSVEPKQKQADERNRCQRLEPCGDEGDDHARA